jgi:hypothetical protein
MVFHGARNPSWILQQQFGEDGGKCLDFPYQDAKPFTLLASSKYVSFFFSFRVNRNCFFFFENDRNCLCLVQH